MPANILLTSQPARNLAKIKKLTGKKFVPHMERNAYYEEVTGGPCPRFKQAVHKPLPYVGHLLEVCSGR